MKVGLIGVGFVGGALLSSFTSRGVEVIAYDKYYDPNKNSNLNGLILNTLEEVAKCELIFFCLPTPFISNYGYDLGPIIENLKALKSLGFYGAVVIKSTVEPGTCARLEKQFGITIFHNPEFLTERTALFDFDNQKHIVIGYNEILYKRKERAQYVINNSILKDLYKELYPDAQISLCSLEESESMKIMCNSFYAMKIGIMNEYYFLCQKLLIDFDIVKEMMVKNGWINPMHLSVPGPDGKFGWGGNCFIKDTKALSKCMENNNTPNDILKAAIKENHNIRYENKDK